MILCAGALGAGVGRAAIPLSLEPDYAEAVLDFHAKRYDACLAKLEALERRQRGVAEFLEMKAMVFSAKEDFARAAAVYDTLIHLPEVPGQPERDKMAYYFELGRVLHHQGRRDAARQYFKMALDMNYNAPAANFFLGVIELESRNYEQAEIHLQRVLRSPVDELKPATKLYLAQLAGERFDTPEATRLFGEARADAVAQVTSEAVPAGSRDLATQVISTVDRGMRSFDRSALLVNVGTSTAYDSNVLALPTGFIGSDGGTSTASFKQIVNFGIAYPTSPVAKFQFVPSYRGSLNYNFNHNTRDGQFFTHDVSLFLTRNALAASQWGIKVQGIGVLQWQTDTSTNNGTLGAYSLTGSFGPYGRLAVGRGWALGADLFFEPTKSYVDDEVSPTLAKSGWDQLLRVYLTRTTSRGAWNPGISFTTIYTRTTGEEFRNLRATLDLGNTMYLGPRVVIGTGVGAGAAWFSERLTGSRRDQTASLTVTAGYRVTPGLSLIGDTQLIGNFSNVSSYRYNRFMSSFGVNYLF